MNLQDIRKYYEYPVIDCCNLQGVEFRAENTLEPGGDAIHKFCLARLQFGEMAEQAVGLRPPRQQTCSIRCRIPRSERYRPKADAQDFMECVICAFHELQRSLLLCPCRGEHQRPRLHFTRRPPLFLRARQLRAADTTRFRLRTSGCACPGKPHLGNAPN